MKAKYSFVSMLFLITLAICASAVAADNSAVLGKWSATLEFQGQSRDISFTFAEADGKLGGITSTPRGDDELSDVAWDGTLLTFSRNIERQGQSFSLSYSATVDGDKMNVTMTTPRGERQFTATRQ